MKALSIKQLRKVYDGGLVALDSVDLDVESGDFFALLGPNGAGKSTLIGIVSSLVRKTSGNVTVCGHDIETSPTLAKAQIGLVPQEFNFNTFEPVIEIIVNSAGYHGIARKVAKQRAEHYLRKLDLWGKHREPARQLSGGMKRRLMIARALVHEPRLLILDEPTAGVDIEIRRSMWEFLTDINRQLGISIILTTHYLEEAEALCKNLAIIDDGRLIEHGSVATLLGQSAVQSFVLDLKSPPGSLDGATGFELTLVDETKLEVAVPREYTINQIFSELDRLGIDVSSLRNKTNRLEEFFLRLTQEASSKSTPDRLQSDPTSLGGKSQ